MGNPMKTTYIAVATTPAGASAPSAPPWRPPAGFPRRPRRGDPLAIRVTARQDRRGPTRFGLHESAGADDVGRRREPVPPQYRQAGIAQHIFDKRQGNLGIFCSGQHGDGVLRCRVQVQRYLNLPQRARILLRGGIAFIDETGVHFAQCNLLRHGADAGLVVTTLANTSSSNPAGNRLSAAMATSACRA